MTQLLVCFAYFFRGLRIMPWVSGIGVFLIAFETLMPGDAGGTLVLLGAVFFLGFPILVGGPFYRQLIGNRRMALVPGLRYFATGALFLLAVCGAALAALVALVAPLAKSQADPWLVGQLAFAMISLYLLVSQWMVSRPATTIGYGFMPIIAFAFVLSGGFGAPESLYVPWAWLTLAGLGWLWLVIAVGRQGASQRWLAARTAGPASDSQAPGLWQSLGAPLDPSSFATAAGTLMRGRGDRWRERLIGALMLVLVLPAVMSMVAVLMAVLGGDAEKHPFGPIFLGVSFVSVYVLPKAIFGEWPARMRMLWLRVAGDRAQLWRRIERTLLQEVVLIASIYLPVAAGFLLLLDTPRDIFLFYLAGAALGTLTSGYAGFLARISDWGFVEQGALFFVGTLVLLFVGVALFNSGQPLAVLGLLPLLLVLALAFRTLARSRFRRMDWCRIRPKRFPRPPR